MFKRDKFLLVQLSSWKNDWWKFPQGGAEEGETEKETIKRELYEELGITDYKIVAKSKYTNTYDWPEDIVAKAGLKWRGQKQKFYLIKLLGNKSKVGIVDTDEVKKFKWVTKTEALKLIDNKKKSFAGYKEVIEKVFKEFDNLT